MRTSCLVVKSLIWIHRMCNPTVQSRIYQSFRSNWTDSNFVHLNSTSQAASKIPVGVPLNRCAEGFVGHSSCSQICLPLFCWTYRRPSIRSTSWSIMVFFCIDWTLPIRSWDEYNNGFNPTCQNDYSMCESDLPPHHPAPWCVVYPKVPSLASKLPKLPRLSVQRHETNYHHQYVTLRQQPLLKAI